MFLDKPLQSKRIAFCVERNTTVSKMSGDKTAPPCNTFKANIFNNSKCQNCFKSRELHLLTDHDIEQAKPIYGGWLCLAPEGTDFDNPMQRSRKWQRRFFILYENGSLSFALDELPSTLPQGTVNMNLCTEVINAEPRTGQRNALCIITPDQDIFIRGDSKDIINGWGEQLAMYPRTNKQSHKKKRKVETVGTQEPSPAKMSVTDQLEPASSLWLENQLVRSPDMTPVWTVTNTNHPEQSPSGGMSECLCPVSREPLVLDGSWLLAATSDGTDPGSDTQPPATSQPNNTNTVTNNGRLKGTRSYPNHAERLMGFEAGTLRPTGVDQKIDEATSREGRSEVRTNKRAKLQSCRDMAQLSAPPPQRRAKSLDCRTSEAVMTPNLLNFKKGWMLKLDKEDQWKKYWFVLSTDHLKYYTDIAEEDLDLEGEIDLTKCYNVSEYQVHRNYGFQIHTQKSVYTLSAMTAGIRRNWIQALLKNVHPSNAPGVTSLPGPHIPCKLPEALPKPDVTQGSSTDFLTDGDLESPKTKSVLQKWQNECFKTFDWAEFRPNSLPDLDLWRPEALCSFEQVPLERKRRRAERRKRYESVLGCSQSWEDTGDCDTGEARGQTASPLSHKNVEKEIEKIWQQVERTTYRLEKAVSLYTEPKAKDSMELQGVLDSYSNRIDSTQSSDAHFGPLERNGRPPNSNPESLRDMYREPQEFLQQQNIIRQSMQEELSHTVSLPKPSSPGCQTPSIWLHDAEGILHELVDLIPDHPGTVNTALLLPVSDSQHPSLQSKGKSRGLNLDNQTTSCHEEMESQLHRQTPSSETQIISAVSLTTQEKKANDCLSYYEVPSCIYDHVAQEQAMVSRLSQEVEMLASQNEALNQRIQEMLNQLTEADREIERLKVELSEVKPELSLAKEEHLEKELNARDQQLLEVQLLVTSLEDRLRDTEAQLREAILQSPGIPPETEKEGKETTKTSQHENEAEYLYRCFQVTELHQSEQTCKELQTHNFELREVEIVRHSERTTETEANTRRPDEEVENESMRKEEQPASRIISASGEERTQQVVEGLTLRSKALKQLLEVIDGSDLMLGRLGGSEEETMTVVSHLKCKGEFYSALLNALKDNPSPLNEEKPVNYMLCEAAENMLVEKKMLLIALSLLSETDSFTNVLRDGLVGNDEYKPLKELDIIGTIAGATTVSGCNWKDDQRGVLDVTNQQCDTDEGIETHLAITRMKMSLLNFIASSLSACGNNKLQFLANFHFSEHPWLDIIYSAVNEVLCYCLISQQRILNPANICSNCTGLINENNKLRARLSYYDTQCFPKVSTQISSLNQTCLQDTNAFLLRNTDEQIENATAVSAAVKMEEENIKLNFNESEIVDELRTKGDCFSLNMDISVFNLESNQDIQKDISGDVEDSTHGFHVDGDQSLEFEEVVLLRERVRDLEEQLAVVVDEMKGEFEMRMNCLQLQHENNMENLKATYECGFATMEESHRKALEELQHRQQREVQRLLEERDRLLEEETTATVTAINSIKNAHRLEVEREVQRICQSKNSAGNPDFEEICQQHSVELSSYGRELEALSQQYSVKCLENRHLVQTLDVEIKALRQCQQENQDLRTTNQELTSHLAAEVTRLCSLAKDDALPHSQEVDIYELEITLRVKDLEVQRMNHEITYLRDELQSAHTDMRTAARKYKDIYAELSLLRATAERDMDHLRENLQLAHSALRETSQVS